MSVIQSKTGLDGKFKANIEFFDSSMECVNTCKKRKITDSNFRDMHCSSYSQDWEGVGSYEEALKIMYDGWNTEVKSLQAIVENCKQLQTDKRISFKNDVCGFAPVVPLALLRVPNAMLNTDLKRIKSKIVSIYYDVTIHCGNKAEQITENGKKVIEAIIRLENMGYRVNLNIIQGYTNRNNGDFLTIKIKSANQHLDLKRVCFPAMHAAMFRVIGFDWYSKFPRGTYRSGYGTNLAASFNDDCEKINKLTEELFGKEAIYISAKLIQDKDTDYLVKVLKEGKYV